MVGGDGSVGRGRGGKFYLPVSVCSPSVLVLAVGTFGCCVVHFFARTRTLVSIFHNMTFFTVSKRRHLLLVCILVGLEHLPRLRPCDKSFT